MGKPLAIDLYCGLGGWAEGFLSEDYDVAGFDVEHRPYPGHLVLQDVLSLHGSQFRDASVIVASPPCQEPSYRAMPWGRAKALNAQGPPVKFIELFEACFRIQREASEAAGRYIPLIVENVKGAQPWVGRAKWHYGSFYLWGDIPALMPSTKSLKGRRIDGLKLPGNNKPCLWSEREVQRLRDAGTKTDGIAYQRDGFDHTRHLTNQPESDAIKVSGINFSDYGKPGYKPQGFNVTAAQRYRESAGVKQRGSGPEWFDKGIAKHSSRSDSRKQASAMIAKIPFPLAQYIARVFKPLGV